MAGLGYIGILTGAVLEGETVLIAAGFAAQQGFLSLPLVLLAAWIGAASGDHFFFVLGRCKGRSFLEPRPSWSGRVGKVFGLIERYGTAVIIGVRFLYGLRTIAPFAIGAAHVRTARFVSFNLLSGLVWVSLFGSAGYLFGAALGRCLADARFLFAFISVVLCVVALMIYRSSVLRAGPRYLSRSFGNAA